MNCMIKILIRFKLCYLRYFIDLSNIVFFLVDAKFTFIWRMTVSRWLSQKLKTVGFHKVCHFFFDWNVRNELWLLLKRMLTWFLSFLFLKGTLIRRHRIPLPPPNDEEFYTVENFNVGQEITLYSRTFKITVSISRYHWKYHFQHCD